MQNCWIELPKPLFIQAPMEDVTDSPFRQMLALCGSPDVYFTEFTNIDGVFSVGGSHVMHRLHYTHVERPIIAQIWGASPENYYNGARYIAELGFDGVDINMGCPQRDIIKRGLCGAMIGNREGAQRILEATCAGAQSGPRKIPVSVKTRIGLDVIDTQPWIRFLLQFDLGAITVHGRTVREKSLVPAHWDEIGKAVQERDAQKSRALIIGNGDVVSRAHGLSCIERYGVDGIMIARAMLDDIRIFNNQKGPHQKLSPQERLSLLKTHMRLFSQTWGSANGSDADPGADKKGAVKQIHDFRKYIKTYVHGFDGAKHLREQLMECTSFQDALLCIDALDENESHNN